jgi:hypothetical protein
VATENQVRLETTLQLARELASQLYPLTKDPDAPDAFALRLAQAQALGLVDQLSELLHVPTSGTATGARARS